MVGLVSISPVGGSVCVCRGWWVTLEACGSWCPQLGPLLFSLYIEDITADTHHFHCHLYADYLQLYRHFIVSESDEAVAETNCEIAAINA